MRLVGAVFNRAIDVNLAIFTVFRGSVFIDAAPTGLGFCSKTLLQRYHPYGIQEVFEVFKVPASYPVRLGMQIAFGRVRRDALRIWACTPQKPNLPGLGLRRLLFLKLTPMETALLANYPNPFNPETWIPYQLATPADVTLRIYAVDGSLVRTLSLGHKGVGMYQSRNRAAYWDGKNALGEFVASGVYFYTLTAGDFTATRKMLIRK